MVDIWNEKEKTIKNKFIRFIHSNTDYNIYRNTLGVRGEVVLKKSFFHLWMAQIFFYDDWICVYCNRKNKKLLLPTLEIFEKEKGVRKVVIDLN